MKVQRLAGFGLLIVLLLLLIPGFESYAQENIPQDVNLTIETEIERAAISPMISYQGRLVEDGGAVTGDREMEFSLWDAEVGGDQVWSMSATTVKVTAGLFHVELAPFDASTVYKMGQDLWLQVSVEDDDLPRQHLMGAPYAFSLVPGAHVEGATNGSTISAKNNGIGIGLSGESHDDSGVYAFSINGDGVEARSQNGHGLYAYSEGPGLADAAIFGLNQNIGGTAVYAQANSNNSSLVSENLRTGGKVFEGYGDDGDTIPEIVIQNNGTLQQEASAYGLVKAGAVINCNGASSTLMSSFTNVIGAPPLAIDNVSVPGAGFCVVDLGFPLSGRYWSVTVPAPTFNFASCYQTGDPTKLTCLMFDLTASLSSGFIMLLVY
jgi:hypothetical protein